MNRLFHARRIPEKQHVAGSGMPARELKRYEVKHDSAPAASVVQEKKAKGTARRALEAAVTAPLVTSCAVLNPKDDWFSYKVVGAALGVLVLAAVVEYAYVKIRNRAGKDRERQEKQSAGQ